MEKHIRTAITVIITLVIIVLVDFFIYLPWKAKKAKEMLTNATNTTTVTYYGNDNIKISSPQKNDTVSLPVVIKGEARVFENVVNVRIKTVQGELITETATMAKSPDIGQFGLFEITIPELKTKDKNVIAQVYWISPKDGSDLDMIEIPLNLK